MNNIWMNVFIGAKLSVWEKEHCSLTKSNRAFSAHQARRKKYNEELTLFIMVTSKDYFRKLLFNLVFDLVVMALFYFGTWWKRCFLLIKVFM